MRIMVTGSKGQLARSFAETAAQHPDIQFIFAGRPDLDLGVPGSAAAIVREIRPDLVINAAAYTAVDQAEAEPTVAFRINADAAGEISEAAGRIGAPIIQLSTDYVFDGSATGAYAEGDPTGPLNVYGASKLAGEEQVRAANPQHVIIRTSWVYSPFGRNFVSTMLDLARGREQVEIVSDQRGCPSSAFDLASGLVIVSRQIGGSQVHSLGRMFHLAGTGSCSWADLAEHVFAASAEGGGPAARVKRVSAESYRTAAARPSNSMLGCTRFRTAFGYSMPEWKESVSKVVRRILATA